MSGSDRKIACIFLRAAFALLSLILGCRVLSFLCFWNPKYFISVWGGTSTPASLIVVCLLVPIARYSVFAALILSLYVSAHLCVSSASL